MPIWALTQERVDKLNEQMEATKKEFDTLEKLSEKDLWCAELDAFIQEWENQLKEDHDIERDIRNVNRRHSRKIGAGGGKGGRGRPKKEDDDFTLGSKASKAPKVIAKPLKPNEKMGVLKIENKPSQRFIDMLVPKAKPKSQKHGSDGAEDDVSVNDSGMSDDDFAALVPQPAAKKSSSTSRAPSEQPVEAGGRSKRAAAAAPKNWVVDDEDSESDDGKLLDDVGDMVKGIGGVDSLDKKPANGRVSLFAMSRPGTSIGDRPTSSSGLPKPKSKANKAIELSDDDETNYEMLARSSPHKAPPAPRDDLNSFLSSDDELLPIVPKKAIAPKAKPAPKTATKEVPKAKKPVVKKATPAPESKPVTLSPAAKAYAAKQKKMNMATFSEDESDDDVIPATKSNGASKKQTVISDDEDEDDVVPVAKANGAKGKSKKPVISDDEDDEPAPVVKANGAKQSKTKKAVLSDEDSDVDMEDPASPPPKPAGRGRPARAAAVAAVAKTKKPIYVDSEDEDDMDADDVDESAIVEEDSEEEDFDDSD